MILFEVFLHVSQNNNFGICFYFFQALDLVKQSKVAKILGVSDENRRQRMKDSDSYDEEGKRSQK